jgi:hypothetical protein
MPKEASNHFGAALTPFLKAVCSSNQTLPYEEMNDIPLEIKNAMICCHGKLTPPFEYISELRAMNES